AAIAARSTPRVRRPLPQAGTARAARSRRRTTSGPSPTGAASALEVLEQPAREEAVEEQARQDDEDRRLREEPPEALAVRGQQRDPLRLRDRPDESGQRGR